MQSFYSFRLTAHTLVYATMVCLFLPVQGAWMLFALLAALSLSAALAATNCSNFAGRFLLGLLPALALLQPVSDLRVCIAAGLAVLYVAISLSLGRFFMELWKYRAETLIILVVQGVMQAYMLVHMTILPSAGDAMLPMITMAFFSMLFSMLALRALRLGTRPTAGWQLCNVGLFALPFLGGGAVAGLLWLSESVAEIVIGALGKFVAYVLIALSKLSKTLMNQVNVTSASMASESAVLGETHEEEYVAAVSHLEGRIRLWKGEIPWKIIFLILGGCVLLLLIVWLILRGKRTVEERRPEEFGTEKLSKEAVKRTRRKKQGKALRNRDQIRTIYHRYLQFLTSNGIKLNRSDTTAEISKASAALLRESDETLRMLYRKARYSAADFTDEEVQSALEALQRLMREENQIKPAERMEKKLEPPASNAQTG